MNHKQNMFCDTLKMPHAVQSIYCLLCFGNVLCRTTCCSCLCSWQDITETDAQCQCELQPRLWKSSSALCVFCVYGPTHDIIITLYDFILSRAVVIYQKYVFEHCSANWRDLSATSESFVSSFFFPQSLIMHKRK